MLEKGQKIRTIVVEDETKILESICRKIIDTNENFEIIGTAENGKDALSLIERLRPQVIFTDISMPVMGGLELMQRIRRIMPSVVIVVVSGYSDFAYAQEAIRFGVFNYLLKPLESEKLQETLFDIQQSLQEQSGKTRNLVYSDQYDLVSENEKVMCLVCLGNVICVSQDEDVNQFYLEKTASLFWKEIMQETCENQEWMVVDEYPVNQKLIEIRTGEIKQGKIQKLMERLIECIAERTDLPIHICVGKHTIVREGQQEYVKRLRNVIRQKLVVGENEILWLQEQEQSQNDVVDIVKMKLNQYVKNYFINDDFEELIAKIAAIFKYMKNGRAPQASIVKICTYVLKLMEFSKQQYNKDLLEELAEDIMCKISISVEEEELFQSLIEELESIRYFGEPQEEDRACNKILEYVNERYLTIESIEEVADEFGYNYAYLSRVFKTMVGESMSKYITGKKIALAKELIETRPEMKLSEVCIMCGYNDSRYFSRVFKKEVGFSPSEYKEEVGKREK